MSRSSPVEAVANDPLISSDLTVYTSPSPSRATITLSPIATAPPSESDPLLPSSRSRKPFYRARPLWLVPFAITAALVRGMTAAPRLEVFTQLACAQLHPHPYNHTISPPHSFSYDEPRPIPLIYLSFEDPGDSSDDPRRLPSSQCMGDAAVQSNAARLQTTMVTTMGLLCVLTTGWWGHFGERHGRTTVMAMSSLGLLLTDLIFILVSTPHSPLASHGHKLLIIAPVIEGLLGGWSTLQSTTSAYISDCTSSGSRASMFSRFSGVFFFGFSMGPAIGGWIIRNKFGLSPGSDKSVAPVFYLAVLCSLINVLLVLFVIPESLSKEQRECAQTDYRVERSSKGKGRATDEEGASSSDGSKTRPGVIHTFLSPLALFLPTKVTDGTRTVTDWSLSILGIGLFAVTLSTGIFQIKYLYADHVYSFGTEKLSYYISFMGGSRAIFLLAVLPLFISTFKPKPKTSTSKISDTTTTTTTKPKPKLTKTHLAREVGFDLFMARLSVLIDMISNVLIVLVPVPGYKVHSLDSSSSSHSTMLFIMASGLACMGSAAVPAVQSLALCILQARTLIRGEEVNEGKGGAGAGKLFGAFSVLQATGQMILGPMLFGLIYSSTVATYPKAVFVVAAGILTFGFLCFLLVRNPLDSFKGKGGKKRKQHLDEEERGRSRVSKDVWGASTSGSSSGSF